MTLPRGFILILCATVALAMCDSALGWGGRMHIDISYMAAKAVPDEMAAWRSYAGILGFHAIDPDLWKGADPSEDVRHYIEPDKFPAVPMTNLPMTRDEFFKQSGHNDPSQTGIAPWVILDLEQRLSQAMAGTNWELAIRFAAAIGHYVGDTHQPLHCTRYFDGRSPAARGIHLRWEVTMPNERWERRMLKPEPGTYRSNLWASICAWIAESHSLASAVLDADGQARQDAGNDVESAAYYETLWKTSGDLLISQANKAATDLAGLWYTAWVDAGRPPIPPPPQEIDRESVYRYFEVKQKTAIPWLFLVTLGLAAGVIVFLSLRPRKSVKPPAV